jgi:hypothetical protein
MAVLAWWLGLPVPGVEVPALLSEHPDPTVLGVRNRSRRPAGEIVDWQGDLYHRREVLAMSDQSVRLLLDEFRSWKMTPEEIEDEEINFIYGSAKVKDPLVTRDMAARIWRQLKESDHERPQPQHSA